MPLLKLWNTIRGRSNSESRQTEPEITTPRPTETVVVKSVAEPAVAAKATKQRLNLFGGSNPHAPLCKLIRTMTAKTVVEIGVEDGSRAIAVMGTLMQNLPPAVAVVPPTPSPTDADAAAISPPAIRYIVVDQFEMAGGETTLKQFHKTTREADVRTTVYPEPIDRALIRVAHTIGVVDLVLIAAPADQWQTPAVEALVKRITHASTSILYRDGADWHAWQPGSVTSVTRAA